MLTLLTATGCRPKAWAICERLMWGQNYAGPVRWIIVDDGEIPQPVSFSRHNWEVKIVRPENKWQPGSNTQAANLMLGLSLVDNFARLLVIEDDDLYHPEYLTTVNDWLDTHDLVGESYARYYNIQSRAYRNLSNSVHASLCSTAMKGEAIKQFRAECKSAQQFIDLGLWKKFAGRKMLHKTKMVVGMKGLPGRMGIGMGHQSDFRGQIDRDGSILREWAGELAQLYLDT
jgi:hypothetical protein